MKAPTALRLAVAVTMSYALTGCETMNNAQTGAVGGALMGGAGGWLASKAACNANDVACRNRIIAAGAVGGAVVGYVSGHERDLQIAQQAAEELHQLSGHSAQIATRMVEVDVPYDPVLNREIGNDQLASYPKERIVQRKKQVQSLASMTVPLKNPNNAAERAQVSNFLLEKANQMSGRQELVIPANSSRSERVTITQMARQKNVLVRETKGANSISLASL